MTGPTIVETMDMVTPEVREVLNLEEALEDPPPPCEGRQECTKVATWRGTHSCCGAQANYCDKCKNDVEFFMGMYPKGLQCNHCGNLGKAIWNRI